MASLGALVAGVSHEINTPVGIGVTAASSMQEQARRMLGLFEEGNLKKSELEHFLRVSAETSEIILRNLQRAADLVHSFKQVAVDQASGERREFAMRSYLDEILLALRPKLRHAPHQVRVECPETLVLDSYPGALAQVLTNLITNTLVHAFPDGRAGHIDIVVRREGGGVWLEYSDDGVGMPPDDVRRVFDPFFTTKRGAGGTGLGMHIVYNLVTQMLGGTIELRSVLGQGTRVTITFPAVLQKAAA
jgi:signal transduction histidine kinase